jgi:hypothetical protein
LTGFVEEIAVLKRMPIERVRDGVVRVHPSPRDVPNVLRTRPGRLRARIIEAVTGYWATCVEP